MSLEAAREKFRDRLAEDGLRITNQRLAILEAALAREEHFTAEELLEHARAIDVSVSRATVYRALPILVASGILREIDIGKNIKFYFAAPDDAALKAQVICDDCNKIFEINAPFLEWYGKSVASKVGLEPVGQRLQVNARCPAFRRDGRCQNRG